MAFAMSPQILGLLGRAYADSGQKDKAMDLLQQLENRPKEQFVRGYIAALIYVGLGDKAKAIDSLEREYLNHNNIDTAWIRGRSDVRSLAQRCAFRGARGKDCPGARVPAICEMKSGNFFA